MKLRGSLLVIVCCLVVEFCNVNQKGYLLFEMGLSIRILLKSVVGVSFLVYPYVGHITDVYLTRYRSLKCSFILLILTFCTLLVYLGFITATANVLNFSAHQSPLYIPFCVIFVVYIVGLAFFQANAIQFGLDQLLEAPTPKLIAFIRWYYWAQNVGSLALFYAVGSSYLVVGEVTSFTADQLSTFTIAAPTFIIFTAMTIAVTAVLIKFCAEKKDFYIQKAGLNPFKMVYKVLKYSWKHKVPEHRSAFTYWEEDIPRRIDLGKNKYGGPFTNEEVEDTKTFLRILPLLLCLFGYHLAGEGYSAPEQLQTTSCPSLPVLILIVINPLHLSALVSVVGIPLYVLQVVLYITVVVNHDTTYWQQHHSVISLKPQYSPSKQCYIVRTGCKIFYSYSEFDCHQYKYLIDNTYLWFIIPQLLNGLSSLLVSMTIFEFICAQAPRTTQGLLIGLWYATFSIRYLVVDILDNLIIERRSWLIYEGVKGIFILLSLVLFSCVSRCYRYRQRDEIVNVQAMIEDTHERWLDQEDEIWKNRDCSFKAQTVTIVFYLEALNVDNCVIKMLRHCCLFFRFLLHTLAEVFSFS